MIEVRGELNLHLSSSGVMSQAICGHPGRFMLLWCRSSSVRFHRFRCGSPKKEGGFWTRPLRCCRLGVTSLLAQCSLLPRNLPLSDCVDAMCEFSAETPSGSDEDEDPAYQNMNNALLDALSNYLCGGLQVFFFNRRRAGPSVLVLPRRAGFHV